MTGLFGKDVAGRIASRVIRDEVDFDDDEEEEVGEAPSPPVGLRRRRRRFLAGASPPSPETGALFSAGPAGLGEEDARGCGRWWRR